MTWAVTDDGVIALPDGRLVRARGLRHPVPDGPAPQLGVYLLGRDPGPFEWEHRWIHWPDFRNPSSTDDALATLREAYDRAATERVELACGGGIGRTGTAVAALAVIGGVPPNQAVAWARAHHHPKAVETPWQKRWVARLAVRPAGA